MAQNTLKGNWNVVKGKIKEQWGQLTDDDLKEINGKKDKLIGKLQQKCGQTRQEAEKLVNKFEQYLS